jgi:hypothetical protein
MQGWRIFGEPVLGLFIYVDWGLRSRKGGDVM